MNVQGTAKPVVLRFDSVSFSYRDVPVIHEASFHLHEGEFAALVGPNGSGKTTILKLLLGLERPSSGSIALFGGPLAEGRSLVGYVPQHAGFDPSFPISVREVVRMGRLAPLARRSSGEDAAVERALEVADVADLAARPYGALSGGQRRRVMVARALAGEPRLLVLDEPTANMDAESERRLFATLGALKGSTTILIVTHDTGFVSSLTDSVLCVGDRGEGSAARGIVRHRVEPSTDAPADLYGGHALKVLHGENVADAACCGKAGEGA